MRAALIGAGQIAAQHLDALRAVTGVELAGVCDLSAAAAESAAERFGVSRWFTDHRAMLAESRPDVVHVTTPPTSHVRLAADSLAAGAHVLVEKPITATLAELEGLLAQARGAGRLLLEDYNYLFNRQPREILARIESGAFGAVVHVEVMLCLDITGPGGFGDPNAPHPALGLPGGAIGDFLPHLASLAHLFAGAHRKVHTLWSRRRDSPLPFDELRALVDGERATAALTFSSSAQPDAFWLRVHGERMQATANLFETRLTFDRLRGGPKPLRPLLNGWEEGKAIRRAATGTLLRKLRGGPGSYEGLFELVAHLYRALDGGGDPPVTPAQVLDVNRLVDALRPAEGAR